MEHAPAALVANTLRACLNSPHPLPAPDDRLLKPVVHRLLLERACQPAQVLFLPTATTVKETLRASFMRKEDKRPKVPRDHGGNRGGAEAGEVRATDLHGSNLACPEQLAVGTEAFACTTNDVVQIVDVSLELVVPLHLTKELVQRAPVDSFIPLLFRVEPAKEDEVSVDTPTKCSTMGFHDIDNTTVQALFTTMLWLHARASRSV
jgi:hypothetical protein